MSASREPGTSRRWLAALDPRRWDRRTWLRTGLDAVAVAFAIATFAQAYDPDVLLHCMWVVLALEAFLFGLRVSGPRVVAASIVVWGYSFVAAGDGTPLATSLEDLDLAEWPLMVVILVIVSVMADRLTRTSLHYAALYRAASERLLTAQEDERRRLAADVHDGVGQTITALSLTLDAAEQMLWAGDDPPSPLSREAIRRAQELAGAALDEVRAVALRLVPPRLAENGLVPTLRDLSAKAGDLVAFEADPRTLRPGLLDEDVELEVYRIVQEALSNALRHANADHVAVTVHLAASTLVIEVADDGVGFDVDGQERGGLGIPGMRDRAEAIGARLAITSRKGRGSRVSLEVPVRPEAAPDPRGNARLRESGAASR